METTFAGRHYETGTIANALAALGAVDPHTNRPYSEALALGASGGIAFGYFTFEYQGHLPHVALLPRNTFAPFERALDNLAIRRETRETTNSAKGEENLKRELDAGNPVVVWADAFSMPYRGLPTGGMWVMQPLLVVGQRDGGFLLADGSQRPLWISAEDLLKARAVVKKDRFRIMTLERPDEDALSDRLKSAIQSAIALFLDKPPAGSADNFGAAGLRHFATCLTASKGPKSWTKLFEPGPRLSQALAGTHGQPGIWDWIESWGTAPGADRGTYADFLREASARLALPALDEAARAFERAKPLWRRLAEESQPDAVPEFARLKELKRRHQALWIEQGREAEAECTEIRNERRQLVAALADPARLAPHAETIKAQMAATVLEIAATEEPAMQTLRNMLL